MVDLNTVRLYVDYTVDDDTGVSYRQVGYLFEPSLDQWYEMDWGDIEWQEIDQSDVPAEIYVAVRSVLSSSFLNV